jgi:Nucleotidyltransferase-like/Helix-turn-helix domain
MVEDILRPIYQEYASQTGTLGILMIEKREKSIITTDSFDVILLMIVKEAEHKMLIKHYSYQDKKAAMHIVTESQMKEWLLLGSNRKMIEWIYIGKILFDRNGYLNQIKAEMNDFPSSERKVKMGLEFAKLIRRYMDGKALFENGQYLDTYNHMLHSLQHLGRFSLIENGLHPEVTVWNQVKKIEPEVFKLYNELINSDEDLEKRLELLFLASDFLIHSRVEAGTSHLVETLRKKDIWTFNEMLTHPDLALYSIDLEVLFEYMIDKHLIQTVNVKAKGETIYHRCYQLAEKMAEAKK